MAMIDLRMLRQALGGEISRGELHCPGPGHSRADRSLCVRPTADQPDGFVVHSFAGDDPIACKDHVRGKLGLPAFKPNGGNGHRRSDNAIADMVMRAAMAQDDSKPRGKIVAAYDYVNAGGILLYQVLRLEPKSFRQRRPDGNGGWIYKLDDVCRVLYRWPALLEFPNATVFICEGEKDADRVASLECCATTVASGKWTEECVTALAGRDIIILQDNDAAGSKKALAAAEALHGTARSIRIVLLPGLIEGEDVSDWLDHDRYRDAEKLIEICLSTPTWVPSSPQDPSPAPSTPPASSTPAPPSTPMPSSTPNAAVAATPASDDFRSPAFSDEALALRFAKIHAHDLRYVAAWNKWLSWDDTRWLFDTTLAAWNEARKVCRAAALECNKLKLASALASSKTVAAVINLARSDRRLAATVEQWNTDIWSANTPKGVIDLHTGKMRAHCPTDYMTKITAVAPDSNCQIPIWLAFLDRVTNGDAELIAFLQRMSGYALTGSTQEHALFFHYGVGANGKTTFINVLTGILGDYHKTAPIETFIASHTEHHPTDLAGLHGARLVTSVETEEGRRWAENKIKALTGGDEISARFMRQDFFEFVPTFKLLIAGNNKPSLRSVDEAIRRRLHLIPWNVVIPPDERDKKLGEKLRAEWPGILAWMIEGCMQWQQMGLAPPKAVTSATDAYMEAEDALTAWIEEQCIRDPQAWERTTALYAAWKAWADKSGEYAGSMKRFSQTLEKRDGVTYERDRQMGRGFRGLRLVGDAGFHGA
jgi:putative DNA primase/helicase